MWSRRRFLRTAGGGTVGFTIPSSGSFRSDGLLFAQIGPKAQNLPSGRLYSLQNNFGISLSVMPQLGEYSVTYNGKSWLGRGILTVLVDGYWYSSAAVTSFEFNGREWSKSRLTVESTKTGSASNRLGAYDFVEIEWRAGTQVDIVTSFRLYRDNPYLVFVQRFPKGFRNYANGNWTVPSAAFPQFVNGLRDDNDLYSWTSGGMFNVRFAYGPASALGGTIDVLLLSDKYGHTMVSSPLSNYLVATQQSTPVATRDEENPSKSILSFGIEGLVQELPLGFEQQFILVVGEGISNTFRRWGKALLDKAGKNIPSKYGGDNMKYPTYWVDWGSYYREHGFKEEGCRTFEDVVLGVAENARKHGLRIGAYMVTDLDQIRYKEGLFDPRADLFPHGLAYLHEKLGVPLEAYTPWLAAGGPYRQRYPFFDTPKGNVPGESMGDVFYSKQFWEDTAKKLKSWGVICLQQDFENVYEGDPVMMASIDRMDMYFKNQARALQAEGITMQYGAQMARNVMESTENPILVSLQAAWDHHVWMSEPEPKHQDDDPIMWKRILFNSTFYGALGIWPSRDQTQTIADPNAFENILLANLLGGEIQLGHRIGECDFSLVRRTYREGDGLILKPDRPISPLDRCYQDEGWLGFTESTIGNRSWYYVLSLPAAGYVPNFHLSDLGLQGSWIIYNWDTRTASLKSSADAVDLRQDVKHEYFIVAPLFENGIAVVGDAAKFVTMADMRVASVDFSADTVRIGVVANQDKSPIIVGYSTAIPAHVSANDLSLKEVSSVTILDRQADGWFWDHQSKLWYVKMNFAGVKEMETRYFEVR